MRYKSNLEHANNYYLAQRAELRALDAEYSELLLDESIEARYKALNRCPSCDGWGDHGVEEESGCLYVCYSCGGTGKYHCEVAQ